MLDTTLFEKGDVVAVALSGGKDSVCLLDLLLKNANRLEISVKAINIDHSIRGIESENDSKFVKDYCDRFNVPLYFKKVDAVAYSKQNGYSLEQGARELRYLVFKEAVESGFCTKVATAHHASDNFETVLFNLFRGSGVQGLTGIKPISNSVIRPLLDVTRQEIDEYATFNDLQFVEDSTNFVPDYTRNYIRLNLVPIILEKFSGAVNSVSRLSKTLQEEDEFLNDLASSVINKKDGNLCLSTTLNPVIFKRATILVLKELGLVKDYEKVHIESVFSLISLKNGSQISLPNSIICVREYDSVVFYKNREILDAPTYNFGVGEFDFNENIVKITPCKERQNGLYIDANKVPKTAVIRKRQNGDTFTKFSGGTKKLKDYLIDKKIPKLKRDELVVIASGSDILAIFGVEISEKVKVENSTTNLLKLEFLKKE